MIEFKCPHCQNPMRVPDGSEGKKGTCKKCGNGVRVPGSDSNYTDGVITEKKLLGPKVKISVIIAILVVLSFSIGAYLSLPPSKDKVIAASAPSVAYIRGKLSTGTGFMVSDDILVTNKHVIANEIVSRIDVLFPSSEVEPDKAYDAELIYEDQKFDVAFLRVKNGTRPLSVSTTDASSGQDILVIGSPGLGEDTVIENAVSSGVISSKKMIGDTELVQISVAVNPGNSGGPVLDQYGKVAGIVTSKATKMDGVGFAIPASDLSRLLEKAESLGVIDIKKNQGIHTARVLTWYATIVGDLYKAGVGRYSQKMRDYILEGKTEGDAIIEVRESLEKEFHIGDDVRLMMETMIASLSYNDQVPDTVKQKLSELWANSMLLKEHFDNPRLDYTFYSNRLDEMSSAHEKLSKSLRLMLGVSEKQPLP